MNGTYGSNPFETYIEYVNFRPYISNYALLDLCSIAPKVPSSPSTPFRFHSLLYSALCSPGMVAVNAQKGDGSISISSMHLSLILMVEIACGACKWSNALIQSASGHASYLTVPPLAW